MARAREEAGDSCLVSGREPSHIIRVSVKTPHDCQEFMLAENSSVRHFKKQISKRLHCDTDRLVLIFTGKILRDQDILRQRGILDGTTVHLVVRNRLSSPRPLPDPIGHCTHRSEASTSDCAGMVARLGWLARSSPDLADFFGQLAQLLMAAPEPVVQFLEDPLVQGLANEKPDNISHVPESSRPVQKPEPAFRTLETLQKAAQQQEVLQADKRGLEALKAVPGGDNTMRPVSSDIQQLMLFTLAPLVASRGHNPGSGSGSGSELCRGEANADSSTDTTTAIPTASVPSMSMAQEVSAGVVAQARGMASNQANSGCRTSMPDSYSGQDLSSQGGQQPIGKATLTSQLRPSPSALRRALHVLQQNPALLHQLATDSPLRHHIPLLPILTNPRALQALVQIEKGLQVLSKEVPDLGPFLWGPGKPHGATGAPETRDAGRGHRTTPVQPAVAVFQLLHELANACSQSTQSSVSSSLLTESKYQQGLEHLKAMGFANHDANLQALMATSGDIYAAIGKLLGEPEA